MILKIEGILVGLGLVCLSLTVFKGNFIPVLGSMMLATCLLTVSIIALLPNRMARTVLQAFRNIRFLGDADSEGPLMNVTPGNRVVMEKFLVIERTINDELYAAGPIYWDSLYAGREFNTYEEAAENCQSANAYCRSNGRHHYRVVSTLSEGGRRVLRSP